MRKVITFILILTYSAITFANEKKPDRESTVFDETFSWQVQAGLSLRYSSFLIKEIEQDRLSHYIAPLVLVDFYYRGFFIQSNHRRADTFSQGAELGYQLKVADNWELDLISKTYLPGFDAKKIIDFYNRDMPILSGLNKRDAGDGLGLRYSHYNENNSFSVDIASLTPLSDAQGWLTEVFYSHIVPYRNWDIYFNTGLTIYQDSIVNYYIGVTESEANQYRDKYSTGAGFRAQFEIFAQQPINESWTFNLGLSHNIYSENIANSPITTGHNVTQAMIGVLYVF